jgi:hypothetical protein
MAGTEINEKFINIFYVFLAASVNDNDKNQKRLIYLFSLIQSKNKYFEKQSPYGVNVHSNWCLKYLIKQTIKPEIFKANIIRTFEFSWYKVNT